MSLTPEHRELIHRAVPAIRVAAANGILSFVEIVEAIKRTGSVDPVFTEAVLRSSYPWRDSIPGWHDYLKIATEKWPGGNPARSLHGLDL